MNANKPNTDTIQITMKRAWNIVSDAFAYLFAGCIFILFSPLFALMFIIFGPHMSYEWLYSYTI